jgi:high-affinity iron transporter
MIAALLITFREGLEAALIVGIVLSYLKKTDNAQHTRYAWAGVGAAVLLSVALAFLIQAAGATLEGQAEEIFEGVMMFLAVAVLTWMIFWMRYQSHTLAANLRSDMQNTLYSGQPRGLFFVTFFAVAREGVETALFLSTAAFASDATSTLLGAILGLVIATLVGFLVYTSTVKLNLRQFFNVTGFLLLMFAAGLFAHGIHEFQEAGVFPIINEHVWDMNGILDEKSTVGEILKAVFGYNGNPSLLEVIGYWAYWVFALIGIRWLVERRVWQAQSTQQSPITT